MTDYKAMYHKAFNALTDADKLLRQAGDIIRSAQQECEDIFIEADGAPVLPLDESGAGKEPPGNGD